METWMWCTLGGLMVIGIILFVVFWSLKDKKTQKKPADEHGAQPTPATQANAHGEKSWYSTVWKFIWTDTWVKPSKARIAIVGFPLICLVFAIAFPEAFAAMPWKLKKSIILAFICLPFISLCWNWKGEDAGNSGH